MSIRSSSTILRLHFCGPRPVRPLDVGGFLRFGLYLIALRILALGRFAENFSVFYDMFDIHDTRV